MSESLKLEQKNEDLPAEWDRVAIGDICTLGGGKTPRKSEPDYWGGNIPWASPKDFDGVLLEETEDKLTEFGVSDSSINRYQSGSIAMVVRSGVLRHSLPVAQLSTEMAVNQDIKVLQPDTTKITSDYLLNILIYEADRIRASCAKTGTTVESIETGFLQGYKIPLPSLPEQHHIADILSKVDEKIQQTDKAIEKTKELKRGLMQDLLIYGVGHDDYEERYLGPRKLEIPRKWEKSRLEDVSEIITRGKQPTYVEEGGIPVLNQSCIYWDGFHPEGLKRLDEEVANGWKDKYWVKKGDVLINSTGKGTLGRALEWTNDSNTHVLDSHITRVHPDNSVLDPTYFRFYLESNHGQKMLYAFCVAGSTGQIELSKSDLQTMPILLPPLEEQQQISEAFNRVNEKIQDEQQTKTELQELKRGLMQDLLTGKVRVGVDD
jgi:type I restriction enzyme S subunit